MNFKWCSIVLLLLFSPIFAGGQADEAFQEGCCVNTNIPRPGKVSQEVVSRKRLLRALNCAIRGLSADGAEQFAELRRDQSTLRVAYYFGRYMFEQDEQDGKALTIAVYSKDGTHGMLYDMDWKGQHYYVANAPALLRGPRQWRVGEINGGLWWYPPVLDLGPPICSPPPPLISPHFPPAFPPQYSTRAPFP